MFTTYDISLDNFHDLLALVKEIIDYCVETKHDKDRHKDVVDSTDVVDLQQLPVTMAT